MIVVTGATGHLGQWAVARLTKLGADVLTISRNPKTASTLDEVIWTRPVRALSARRAVVGPCCPSERGPPA